MYKSFSFLTVLTAVAAINNAIDLGNDISLSKALENPDAQLSGADESLGSRYLTHFIAVKKEKREVSITVYFSKNHLTHKYVLC